MCGRLLPVSSGRHKVARVRLRKVLVQSPKGAFTKADSGAPRFSYCTARLRPSRLSKAKRGASRRVFFLWLHLDWRSRAGDVAG